MRTGTLILVTAIVWVVLSCCRCDTHYVSTNGSSEYPYTTPETAATRIQDAIDAASPGDTVRVGGGEYREDIEMKPSLHLVGDGRDSTRIIAATEDSDIVVAMGENSTFAGFTVVGGRKGVYQLTRGARSYEISDCRVLDAKRAGIVIQGQGAVVGCILCSDGWGIWLPHEAGATVRETILLKNSDYGIYFTGSGTLSVEHCTISGNGGAFGFFDAGSHDVLATNSIIYGNVDDTLDKTNFSYWSGLVKARNSMVNDASLDNVDGNRYVDPGFVGYGAFNDTDNPTHVDANFSGEEDGTADKPFSRISSALAIYDYELGLQSPCIGAASDGTNIGALPDFIPSRPSGNPSVLIEVAEGTYPEFDLRLMHSEHVNGEGTATRLEPPPSQHCSLFDTTCFRPGNRAVVEGLSVIGACRAFELDRSSPTIRDCMIYDCGSGFFCHGSRGNISRCLIRDCRCGIVWAGSSDVVENCTIVECSHEGLYAWAACPAHISDSILWHNRTEFLNIEPSMIDHCNSEDPMFAGQNGNISIDPLFVGWGGCVDKDATIYVDAAAPEGGDGTRSGPFRAVSEALEFVPPYDYRLSAGSPCLTAGSSGGAIGAFPDHEPGPIGVRHLVLNLAPGTYRESSEIVLQVETSLVGGGKDLSVVHGATVRPGFYGSLQDLTISEADTGVSCPSNWRGEISGCRIASCEGGLEIEGAATITDCEIVNNGWGLRGEGDIIRCLVANNSGDGIHLGYETTSTVEGCTICGNGGDGIWCIGSYPTIRDCRIFGNKGAGISLFEATASIEACIVYENGCGIDLFDSYSCPIVNCAIFGHIAAEEAAEAYEPSGVGIRCGYATPRLVNCTVSGNSYGIACEAYSGAELTNCIVQGNFERDVFLEEGELTATYSNVGGMNHGEANIDADPRFVDAENGDFRLSPDSPCIDAGTVAEPMPEFDLAGMHRVMFGGKELRPDMGAFEYYINELAAVASGHAMILTWSSLAGKSYSVLYSENLFTWEVAEEGIVSWGDMTTSWMDSPSSGTQPPPAQARRRYYKVLEEE